jgi:hypothetical protein
MPWAMRVAKWFHLLGLKSKGPVINWAGNAPAKSKSANTKNKEE